MKKDKIFYLGLMLLLLGVLSIFTLHSNAEWYVRHMPNKLLLGMHIAASFITACGGYVMIVSRFER